MFNLRQVILVILVKGVFFFIKVLVEAVIPDFEATDPKFPA
jgi:hypothetical protein